MLSIGDYMLWKMQKRIKSIRKRNIFLLSLVKTTIALDINNDLDNLVHNSVYLSIDEVI